ncbi:MAG: UDP-glucose 4-epimerase [bacterium]|nr:MAG: UDP-glucose 4-epimerase [bacterium]
MEVTHVYGPGQRTEPYRKAIPNFIVRALRGEALEVYGSGQKYMDCLYVEDCAKALRLAAESPKVNGKVFQVESGEKIKVVDLALKIISLTNSKSILRSSLPMRHGEPDEDDSSANVNSAEFSRSFDWSLNEGLLKAIEWYSKHL